MKQTWLTVQEGNCFIHLLRNHKFKMVSVLAQVEIPLAKETVTKTALLPQLLLRATKSNPDTMRLTRAFDSLYGTNMSAYVTKNGNLQTLEWVMRVPGASYLPNGQDVLGQALSLFIEVMMDPYQEEYGFAKEYVQTELSLHKQRIENSINDKGAYASKRCQEIMFEGQPYGLPKQGFLADVDLLTAESLYAYHQALMQENALHIYLVGPIDEQATFTMLTRILANYAWRKDKVEQHRLSHPQARQARSLYVNERFEVNQAKLNLGYFSGIHYEDDDYEAMQVANGILGGFPHSKLFVNVREKESLAYSAFSRYDGLNGTMLIHAGIDGQVYLKARSIIEAQIDDLQQGKITDDELFFTQDALLHRYRLADDQPLTQAGFHHYHRLTGRDRSTDDLIEGVRQVTKADVQRVAQSFALDTIYLLQGKGD